MNINSLDYPPYLDCPKGGDTQLKQIDINAVLQKERVEHPKHYTWLKELCGIEVIDITRHLNFNCGNAIKYLLRKDKEDIISLQEKRIEDLKKAKWYIEDEIKRLENGNRTN